MNSLIIKNKNMPKKYLLWIVAGVILAVMIFLSVTSRTEAPTEPAQPSSNANIVVPENINLEDPAVDIEGDASDLDVSEEISEDFDDEDFDDEAIDDGAF